MTDDGVISSDEENIDTDIAKPAQPKTQQRKQPEPEPTVEEGGNSQRSNNRNTANDSAPQNPLTVTPVERMPVMPE